MKLLTCLLFVALVGQISAHAYPRYAYRAASEESSEAEDAQSDEADVENDNEEPQDDDISEEDEQDKPPTFNKLFPSPQTGRPGSGGGAPTNFAFHTMMHEIDENGWKRPKENPKNTQRQRSVLVAKPVFRNDENDSEEEDEEDDAEDDEPYGPDFDTMFPNPEGKQVGPTNMAESQGPFGQDGTSGSAGVLSPGSISGSGGVPSFERSDFYQGRSQGRQSYFSAQSGGQPSGRYVQKPTYSRATVQLVRSPVSYRQVPSYGSGNQRVVQVQASYRPSNYYNGNRRVVQAVGYRPSSYNMGGYRQPSYNSYNMGGYRQPNYNSYNMGGYRQSAGYNMGGYRQTGPVYVDNYGRRQQYVSSPVRRQYVSSTYAKRPVQQYSQSPYVMRTRRNQRFWKSH